MHIKSYFEQKIQPYYAVFEKKLLKNAINSVVSQNIKNIFFSILVLELKPESI